MRGLSNVFLSALKSGLLYPLLERVRIDRTLDLQIREDYINIYYRGGNLMKVQKEPHNGFRVSFDSGYSGGKKLHPNDDLITLNDVQAWISAFPEMKNAMDIYFGNIRAWDERENQQVMIRENNYSSVANSTDYYICDIEYADSKSGTRLDAVAAKWISSGAARKNTEDVRLAIIEMKFGDSALKGSSGLYDHVKNVISVFGTSGFHYMKNEMLEVFNQKLELGLISDCKHSLISFSDQIPEYIIAVSNHDPQKTALNSELNRIRTNFANQINLPVEIKIAKANKLGYALYEQNVVPL